MEEATKVESPVKESVDTTTPGKRQRKQVDFFATSIEVAQKKDHSVTAAGSGTKLAQYDYFLQELTKVKGDSDVVKCLHTLMYNTPGRKTSAKHNLREFNGFGSDVNVKEKTEKVVENKKKWTISLLKEALSLFGVERGGNREELCERLVEYLAHPRIVVAPGKTKRRRSASKSPKKKSKKSKGEKVKRAPTAYLLFCSAHRAAVKEQNADMSFTDIGKALGDKWNALSPEEKEVWQAKAAEEKAKFAASGGEEVAANDGEYGEGEEEGSDAEDGEEEEEDDGAESDDLKSSDDEEEFK